MLPGTPSTTPLMLFALLLPTIVALIILATVIFGKPLDRKNAGIFSSLALGTSFFLLLIVFNQVLITGQPLHEEYPWFSIGSLTVGFSLLSDFLSLPLSLAILGLATISSIYSIEYIKEKHDFAMYYFLLLLFAVGMVGVTLSTNLIQFFIFFEGMNIPAYFLVSNWGTPRAKTIGLKYILYVVVGALCLLAGIAWTFGLTQTFDIYDLPSQFALISTSGVLIVQSICFLMSVGFFVKMAIVPLHSWLPDFHGEAPVPIHALLSAVMIKTGAYGFVRISYFFFPEVILRSNFLLAVLALTTMIWGAAMALVQVDFKRVLAYSSANQIGYILLGLSTMTEIGIAGSLFHVITHGFAKGILLYCAGSLVHSAGTKYINKLGGVAVKMPVTATIGLVGALAIAGTPPMGTFASEVLIFLGVFQASILNPWFIIIGVVGIASTALTAAYYLWTIRRIFFGPPSEALDELFERYKKGLEIPPEGIPRLFEDVHESPTIMTGPMLLVAFLVVFLGIFPWLILQIIYPFAQQLILTLLGGL